MKNVTKIDFAAPAAETPISESAAAVLAHQAKVEELNAEVKALNEAIAEQSSKAAALRHALPNVAEIDARLDDLMADVALGKADTKAVMKLEAERSEAKESMERIRPELDRISRTLVALERKASDAMMQIRQMQDEKPALMRRFLMDEAEAECVRYVANGGLAATSYMRLRGLEALLESYGSGFRLCESRESMMLPAFNLKASQEGPRHFHLQGIQFKLDARFDSGTVMEKAMREKEALHKRFGIEF